MKTKATPIPYDLHKSVLPSIFLSSPIFSPKRNGNNNRELIFFSFERNKNERLSYFGYELDCDLDFRIYSLIISKSLLRDDFSITLTMNEFFDVLNTNKNDRHISKFNKYLNRLELLKNCTFFIDYYKNGFPNRQDINVNSLTSLAGFNKSRTSYKFVEDYQISKDGKSVKIYIEYDIRSKYFSPFDKEIIDLNKFSKFKTQYEKSLYLLFLTKKFKENSYFFIRKNELYRRLDRNLKITDSKIELITNEILKKFLEFKFYKNFIYYNKESIKFHTNK